MPPSLGTTPLDSKRGSQGSQIHPERRAAALLGFTQRTIHVVCASISRPNKAKKLIPVEPKTLGDWLVIKRIEADLSQQEVSQKLRVGDQTVRAWEHDEKLPSEDEWRRLSHILSFGNGAFQELCLAVELSVGFSTESRPTNQLRGVVGKQALEE